MMLDDTIKGARRVNGRIKLIKPLIFESCFLFIILCSPTHLLFCVYDGYKHYLTNLIQIKKMNSWKKHMYSNIYYGFYESLSRIYRSRASNK